MTGVLDDLLYQLREGDAQGAGREVTEQPAPSTRGLRTVADLGDGRQHGGAWARIDDLVHTTEETDEGTFFMLAGRGDPVGSFDYRVIDAAILDRLRPWERRALDSRPNFTPRMLVARVRSEWDELRCTTGYVFTGQAGQDEEDAIATGIEEPVLEQEPEQDELPVEKLTGWRKAAKNRQNVQAIERDVCVACKHEGRRSQARNTFAGERLCDTHTFESSACLRSGKPLPWHQEQEEVAA